MININIVGTHSRINPVSLEASWNGGAYSVFDYDTSGGNFNDVFTGLSAGQGTLNVRWVDYPTYIYPVNNVGAGDIFIISGQSNAGEIADNIQLYSHATLKAGCYETTWQEMSTGALLSISKSCWPLVATQYLANQGVPVGFSQVSEGSTTILQWQKGGAKYDRIITRYTALGGAKCLLEQIGESDAAGGTTQTDFQTYMGQFVDDIFADIGLDTMISKLQTCSAYTTGQRDTINAAIDYVVANNAHALAGPDFSDYTLTSAVHFQTDAEQAVQGARWWAAIQTAYGW